MQMKEYEQVLKSLERMDKKWHKMCIRDSVRKAEAGDGLSRCKRGTSHFGKSGWQWEAVMRSEIK